MTNRFEKLNTSQIALKNFDKNDLFLSAMKICHHITTEVLHNLALIIFRVQFSEVIFNITIE